MRVATFIGTLGKDWESKEVGDYTIYENSLAVKAGKNNKETLWINLTQWGEKVGAVMQQYSGKGTKIAVTGDVDVRAWKDSSGEAKCAMSCRVDKFEFLSFKDDGASDKKEEDADTIPF